MATDMKTSKPKAKPPRRIAVIGAGIAGIACARTLQQAGHHVTVFDKNETVGGRMATTDTPFGTFDYGAQYFTVRDPRFLLALQATAQHICRPWSANLVRVLDSFGRVASAALPGREPHWVPTPGMNALVEHWAQPFVTQQQIELQTRIVGIERDRMAPKQWQLRTHGTPGAPDAEHVFSGFDQVLLATTASQAQRLLFDDAAHPKFTKALEDVRVGPCWTLLLAYPQASQPNMSHLGPQWNAARSNHHRIAWLARESSKPRRGGVERWTVQASAAWSHEHLEDDTPRVQAKLLKAFAEVTGIRAEPAMATVHCWGSAQTIKPLGRSHLWDAKAGLGLAGDWCLGHRVEDAFISGLELALSVA